MRQGIVPKYSILLIAISLLSIQPSIGAELNEKDRSYIEVPIKAWNEFKNLSKTSEQKVKIKMLASASIDEKSKMLYQKGSEDMFNKFSSAFDKDDTFYIIMASNYDDAEKFINQVNLELANYSEYNKRHLSIAKQNFFDFTYSFAGGTSSRNCFYQGSAFGDQGYSVIPCPALKGGVVYFFNSNPSTFIQLERIGAHEAFHIILSKVNPMSHYRVPDWIIEGTMEAISFALVTNAQNYKMQHTFFNPAPVWRPSVKGQIYDLGKFDNQKAGDDSFSIGFLATSLLMSEVGKDKYYKFISTMGYPKDWKSDFSSVFGFSVEDFYKKFSDYHSWYFYEGGFGKIQNNTYFIADKPKPVNSSITCVKGKTTKKVTGLTPKCPKGFKKK